MASKKPSASKMIMVYSRPKSSSTDAYLNGKAYLGMVCKNGHTYKNTGLSLRYKCNHCCVECLKEGQKRRLEAMERLGIR